MIRNYIIVALRNIWKNLNYTVINVSGLALGITCSLILFLLITFLTSFDDYHIHANRIYRVVTSAINNNGIEQFGAGVPVPLPEALKSDISGIENVLFISSHGEGGGLITIEENGQRKIFEEDGGFTYTDSLFFKFFNRDIISGRNVLSAPNEAILSRKFAKKYFTDAAPVGKIIRLNNATDLKIIGVMEDYPHNTNFPFDLLISYATKKSQMDQQGWGSVYSNDECYVMLPRGSEPENINRQFPEFIKKYEDQKSMNAVTHWLQPLREVNRDARFSNFRYRTVAKEALWAMSVVALFLIITASINFINLTTAIAVKRSKEIGIRKVLGSQRTQLVFQHLLETGMTTFLALFISLFVAELGLMQLNRFIDLDLHVSLTDPHIIFFSITIWLLITLSAGLYPAFLMSGFSPILALKNTVSNRSAGGFQLRRGLVVFQFIISQFLIVGTIILLAQMKYFSTKDLGFRKEAILNIPVPEPANQSKKTTLKSEVERLAGVERASLCNRPPSSNSVSTSSFRLEGIEADNEAQLKMVDENYPDLFDLTLVAGKLPNDPDTATACLVNETLVSTLALEKPEDILGRNISVFGKKLRVAGVVKDFHTASLAKGINPVILFSEPSWYYTLSIRLKPGEFNSTVKKIERLWVTQYPDHVFSYEFLDQHINDFYEDAKKMSLLLVVFSIIAIVIGCLGLYGLISFMANSKEKEIGIRKVLGATTTQIIRIFSKEFIGLIMLAFVIASPLAGYLMEKWLQNFAYRIQLDWLMFTGGILITLIISCVTIGYRCLMAARTNPVDVLRSE